MLLTHDENQTLSQIKDYINNMQYKPDREMPLLHQFKRRAETDVEIDRRLFCRSTVGDEHRDEPWNGEKETMLLCRLK
jgi:hypothetical protein